MSGRNAVLRHRKQLKFHCHWCSNLNTNLSNSYRLWLSHSLNPNSMLTSLRCRLHPLTRTKIQLSIFQNRQPLFSHILNQGEDNLSSSQFFSELSILFIQFPLHLIFHILCLMLLRTLVHIFIIFLLSHFSLHFYI